MWYSFQKSREYYGFVHTIYTYQWNLYKTTFRLYVSNISNVVLWKIVADDIILFRFELLFCNHFRYFRIKADIWKNCVVISNKNYYAFNFYFILFFIAITFLLWNENDYWEVTTSDLFCTCDRRNWSLGVSTFSSSNIFSHFAALFSCKEFKLK